MARAPQVTRTFTTTKAKILAVNVSTEDTEIVEMVLPREYPDDKALLKQAEKQNDNLELKLVHVVAKETVETLYGMSEADFLKYAKPIPPRSVKEDAANNADVDAYEGDTIAPENV